MNVRAESECFLFLFFSPQVAYSSAQGWKTVDGVLLILFSLKYVNAIISA